MLSMQCGFSARAINVLRDVGCSNVVYIDVLRSERIRRLVKTLTNWPTIPQLFVGGEFVGGVDAMTELAKSGELRKLLEANNAAVIEGVDDTAESATDNVTAAHSAKSATAANRAPQHSANQKTASSESPSPS